MAIVDIYLTLWRKSIDKKSNRFSCFCYRLNCLTEIKYAVLVIPGSRVGYESLCRAAEPKLDIFFFFLKLRFEFY